MCSVCDVCLMGMHAGNRGVYVECDLARVIAAGYLG